MNPLTFVVRLLAGYLFNSVALQGKMPYIIHNTSTQNNLWQSKQLFIYMMKGVLEKFECTKSEAINRRSTDNTMAKRRNTDNKMAK